MCLAYGPLYGVVLLSVHVLLTVVRIIIIIIIMQREVRMRFGCGSPGSAARLLCHSRQHCSFRGVTEVECFPVFQYQTTLICPYT